MEFHGYRIKSTNIARVNTTLNAGRVAFHKQAVINYHQLLSEEIARLVDNIALNIEPAPNRTILEEAIARLNNKIQFTESCDARSEYNFRAAVQIVTDKDYTYLLFFCNNPDPVLEEAFAAVKGIEDYRVKEEEADANGVPSERLVKWVSLQKQSESSPSAMTSILTSPIEVDESLLILEGREARIQERARHELLNQYLKLHSFGREIPASELMHLVEKALVETMEPSWEPQFNELSQRLEQILPELTLAMITGRSDETATPDSCSSNND